MAVTEGQFQELEKRFAAFKYVFGRLQTSYDIQVNFEPFPTSPQVYLDSLINGQINFVNSDEEADSVVQPARTRTWQIGTHTGTQLDTDDPSSDNLWSGNFVTTTPNPADAGGYDPATNPNVEKVIIPLVKMSDTNNQAYFAYEFQGDEINNNVIVNDGGVDSSLAGYNSSHIAYGSVFARGDFANSPYKDRRLKRFIDPVRFGKSYTAEIRASDDDRTTFDGAGSAKILPAAFSTNEVKQRGGWIFDYNEGMLYMAPHKNEEFPYTPGYKHPLWLIAYRYIGPTGSNMTVTGAETSNTSDSSTGGGGVSTTLFSQTPNIDHEATPHPLLYDINTYGWYDQNTQTATDSEDIIEYVSPDGVIAISASIGDRDLIVRLDSSSYNNITHTSWPYYGVDDSEIYNKADLFKFGGESKVDYSSYGLFRTTGSQGYHQEWITQSFEFTSPIRLDQIGLCYSANNNVDATLNQASNPATFYYPAGYKLEGSTNNVSFQPIASAFEIRSKTIAGTIKGPIGSEDDNLFGTNNNNDNWPNNVDETAINGPIRIYCATASITDPTRYKYYRLYVSGGISGSGTPDTTMALHHVDLWQNLDFGPTNRKQVNFTFNNRPTTQQGIKGDTLTIFDLAISASAAKLGLVSASAAGLTFFKGGEINQTLTAVLDSENPLPIHLQGFSQVSASNISASNSITTGILTAMSMSGNGDGITFNSLDVIGGETTVQDLIVQNNLNVQSGFALPSNIPIFLTNKRQDGTDGTDEFSARIFGNYIPAAGVSDMYLDAYRIYTVADAKMHMRTLHPTLGTIVLQSPQTHISGSLLVENSITASAGLKITGNSDIQISGSILISGSLIPNTDTSLTSSFSLGSSEAAWKDLHLSDGTIKFYDSLRQRAAISLDSNHQVVFTNEGNTEFTKIRASEINLGPVNGSSVQISDNGRGYIAVSKNGSHATILRAEDQALSSLGADAVHGSLTQKGSGSFAIILDANDQNQARSKFSIISNNEFFNAAQVLFQVSESGETKIHGYLNVSQSITANNITVSDSISANTFTGTFIGTLSSSAQIASDISGSFIPASASIQSRLNRLELGNTTKRLISGSDQISTAISGAFSDTSASLSRRIFTLESNETNLTSAAISGAISVPSASLANRITEFELIDHSVFATISSLQSTNNNILSLASTSSLQNLIDKTASYATIGNNVTFDAISGSSVSVNTVSASNLHATIFNPAKITTTEFTASHVNLGDVSNTRTFTTDDFNTLFAADTRPTLTVKNAGGGDITYFGSPVDNADAFIKFQTDRSNTKFSVGIDSHDNAFKITEAATLNENDAGSTGFPTFKIIDNKVGIVKSTVSYTLDVGGDIRSSGVMRVDTIRPQTYGAFGTPLPFNSLTLSASVTASGDILANGTVIANAFVGDGTGLSGIATVGSVVLNSATASFLTESPFTGAMISGSFNMVSNSLETRLTTVEGATVTLPPNLVSSSAQISSNISGSSKAELDVLRSATASYALISNVVANSATASFLTESPFTGTMISGSFNAVSTSLQNRIGILEQHDHSTFALKTAISGAFNGQTSSFALTANVVANLATASFVTTATTIDGGTF